MTDPERILRARAILEKLEKYKGKVTSEDRIAQFAAWFAEQEHAWKPITDKEPVQSALVLLKDTKRNIVHLGWRTIGNCWEWFALSSSTGRR